MTGDDRHPRCGRCVRTSALRAVGQGNHCRIRDPAHILQRQGVQAIAALERDDRPTIRERVPRRLPDGTGNRTTDAKQTVEGRVAHLAHRAHSIAAEGDAPPGRRRTARVSRLHMFPLRIGVLAEAAGSKTVGVVSPPMRGPMHGAFTPGAPARSPRAIRRWTLRRRIRDDRPQPGGTVLVTLARRLHVDLNRTETGSIAR